MVTPTITEEDDLYKRHTGVDMKVPDEIFIVGCGGTGTWTSIIAAMIGVKIIHVADFDALENHNRSRLPYKEEDVGGLKTDLIKQFITSIRPDCTVYTYDGLFKESDLLVLTGDVIFDCNDDFKVQKMLFKWCKEHNLRYLGVGCNSDHLTILENLDLVSGKEDAEEDRYVITPMFLIPALIAPSCALWNVIKGKKNIHILKKISDMFER